MSWEHLHIPQGANLPDLRFESVFGVEDAQQIAFEVIFARVFVL